MQDCFLGTLPKYIFNVDIVSMRLAILMFCGLLLEPLSGLAEPQCPPSIQNFHECALYRETEISHRHPQLLSRSSGSLTIKLTNGTKKLFQDVPFDLALLNTGDVVAYAVIGYFPRVRYCLLSASFYEGGAYLLLNTATGATTDIEGEVTLSPDGRRFVSWSDGIESAYSDNALSVYRIARQGLIPEFSVRPTDWAPTDVAWHDPRSIRFSKRYWENGELKAMPQVVKFLGTNLAGRGKWQIQ